MLEKAAMRKRQFYEWHKYFFFVMAMRISAMSHTAGNHQVNRMTETLSVYAMLCEGIDERDIICQNLIPKTGSFMTPSIATKFQYINSL
jgi:hypothetical protein